MKYIMGKCGINGIFQGEDFLKIMAKNFLGKKKKM